MSTQIIRALILAILVALVAFGICSAPTVNATSAIPDSQLTQKLPDLYEASIAELQEGLEKGLFTSVDLVKVSTYSCLLPSTIHLNSTYVNQAYFARIEEVNLQGPVLLAVIETNPTALAQAAELDRERKLSGPRSLLHGIPLLVKDNIATERSEGMNTTAGAHLLCVLRLLHYLRPLNRLVRIIAVCGTSRRACRCQAEGSGSDHPRKGQSV